MNEERFIVKFIPVKNCFVYISNSWLRRLSNQNGAIKLRCKNKEYFVSHAKSQSSGNDFLCLSATFGKCLNIKEGDEVFASWIDNLPVLTSVIVTPVNYSDWEIVRLQADKIQAIMLDQIIIVKSKQAIVVWLSKYLNVTLSVDSIVPNFLYGKLENHTEIHVQETPKKSLSDFGLKKIFNSMSLRENNIIDYRDLKISLNNYKRRKLIFLFRVCKEPNSEFFLIDKSKLNREINSPHSIFMRKVELKNFFFDEKNLKNFFGRLKKVSYNNGRNENVNFALQDIEKNDDDDKEIESIDVRLLAIEDFVDEEIFKNNFLDLERNVWIPEPLRKNLGLQLGSKIHLEPLEILEDPVTTIILTSSTNSTKNFENYIKKYSKNTLILLRSGSRINFEDNFCTIEFLPNECEHILLTESKLHNLKILPIENKDKNYRLIAPKIVENFDEKMIKIDEIFIPIFRDVLVECRRTLSLSFGKNSFSYNRENILLLGDTGSGKSTLFKIFQHEINEFPWNITSRLIECKKLKGKKSEMIYKLLNSVLSECAYYQPSVIFLDDLETLINFSPDADENSADALNQWKIADLIVKLLTSFQSRNLISIVASCRDMQKLGSELKSSRGGQLFRTIVKIPSLVSTERIQLFQRILKKKLELNDDVNWERFGRKTEGWVAQDLVDLSEKSSFVAWKRQSKIAKISGPLNLRDEDLVLTMKTSKPLALHGVSLYTGEETTWSNIGGLEDVKKSLVQLLQWPLMYPGLFSTAPVKHQSGILLYGMPGTGKTIIAGAIAKECGLNFINIKGPELLSKYIGASEEAVRKIFFKAQMAKPCVLFFDEFDSFAPRRGHDSTGVTDRVVNQLLTQFDGVEGRDGVAIVAATSRPDLLDPALLRPGRLDKAVYCPLPDEGEREKILEALCTSQSVNYEKLNLSSIAKLTSGYTGADLNAILTQARLDSLEQIWSTTSPVEEKNIGNVNLTQEELINAVDLTQPSLTSLDMTKFKQIYKRFSKGGNFTDEILKNQKSTLA